ncbi:hypothetical protein QUA43_06530 [Microcoleus sp. N9_B4]
MKSLIQYLGITGFILPATASQIPSTFQKFLAFILIKARKARTMKYQGNQSILTEEMQPLK